MIAKGEGSPEEDVIPSETGGGDADLPRDEGRPRSRNRSRRDRFPLGASLSLAALADDPYPVLDELREREPVTWSPALGMWLLTRRDDIVRVLADWRRFTTDSPASTIRDNFGSQMLTTDGDAQIRYKRRFIGPFRRGALEENLAGTVRAVLDGVMAGLGGEARAETVGGGKGGCAEGEGGLGEGARGKKRSADLRMEVARPVSVRSICRVLGLPDEDAPRLLGWYDRFAAALENFAGDEEVRSRGKAAAREFRRYVTPFLRGERSLPEGSLIGELVGGEGGGNRPVEAKGRPFGDEPLNQAEIVANLLIVLFGGIETTESMISTAIWAALVHPEVAARLAAEPRGPFLRAVIEESMRWDPAVQSCTRFTTEPVELGGVRIPAGETVQCMLGAANRDPAHFPAPNRFDPARPNLHDHLAFGAGRHFCLGASLARIEAEETLARLFGGLCGLRLDPSRPSRPYGHEFRAPPGVWVRWDHVGKTTTSAT